jgi:hypothetical protein
MLIDLCMQIVKLAQRAEYAFVAFYVGLVPAAILISIQSQ